MKTEDLKTRQAEYPNDIDDPLKDGKRTDIVILVMGPSGAGKSTLINCALNKNRLAVSHSLIRCTTSICPVTTDPSPQFPLLAGRRLILVEFPAFNGSFADDVENLKRIAEWLAASYRKRMPIHVVLYLHPMYLNRLSSDSTYLRNLGMCRHLCGDRALRNVVFVTTHWEHVRSNEGELREEEWKSIYWKDMMDRGAEVARFVGTQDSAWEILKIWLQRVEDDHLNVRDPKPLLIQQELVDRRLLIRNTEGGKWLLPTPKTYKILEAAAAGDPKARAELDEARAIMRKLEDQIQTPKASFPHRVLKWLQI